jgi:hypothetical protein
VQPDDESFAESGAAALSFFATPVSGVDVSGVEPSDDPPTPASAATRHPLGSQVQVNCSVGQSSGSEAQTPCPFGAVHQPQPETGVHVPHVVLALQVLAEPP